MSFDLDNTLWKTGPTIQAANDKLAEHLDEEGIIQPERVEKVMGQLFKENPSEYTHDSNSKSPVQLTLLRKNALKKLLMESNGFDEKEAIKFSESAFGIWTEARHNAIPNYLASNVIECLEVIRGIRSRSDQPLLIGAITDGNSNPLLVPTLSKFFDFVVNAESVGMAKPHKGIYLAAVKEAATHPYLEDIFTDVDVTNDNEIEDAMGGWWVHIGKLPMKERAFWPIHRPSLYWSSNEGLVHVGDDFTKDVVASKAIGMRSIWCQELVKKEEETQQNESLKSSMSVEELVKKVAENGVLKISVGADDYLAQSIESEFADATLSMFEQIGDTLINWQEMPNYVTETTQAAVGSSGSKVVSTVNSKLDTTVDHLKPSNEKGDESTAEKIKYCISCGTKLPMKAKFCSTCGEKQ